MAAASSGISAPLIWAFGQEFSEKDSDRVSSKDSRIYPARALCWPCCSVKRLTCHVFSLSMIVSHSILFLILCLHNLLLSSRTSYVYWSLVCTGAIVQKSFDTSFPSTYLQGQLRAKLSQEREERYQDCASFGLYLPYPYVMWKGWTPLHALFVSWCFFHRSLLRILLFNDWDQMSGRVQQIGLTGQPTIETIPGGKPSVRSEIWVNVSAFFQLDTIIMSDRQFWFLLSSLNTVLAENFGGLWWWSVFCDVMFVGAIAVALRAQLLMELTCAYSSAQSLPGNCRQIRKICKLGLWGSVGNSLFTSSLHIFSPNGSISSFPGSPHNWSQDCRLGELAMPAAMKTLTCVFFGGLMVAMLSGTWHIQISDHIHRIHDISWHIIIVASPGTFLELDWSMAPWFMIAQALEKRQLEERQSWVEVGMWSDGQSRCQTLQ